MDKDEIIKEILEENAKLKEELQATKEHLKKYTAPAYKKEYYEKNKDVIKERNNNSYLLCLQYLEEVKRPIHDFVVFLKNYF